MEFLSDYLLEYWLSRGKSDDLWSSWSDFGLYAAAEALGCLVEKILPTTNYLESFNRVLKHKHLPQAQHGGHRLRFDVLIMFIITDMIPSIFQERQLLAQEHNQAK
ncbi:hypothetical protein Moror_16700, partial [Moniliophthora roreri MCA 2997]